MASSFSLREQSDMIDGPWHDYFNPELDTIQTNGMDELRGVCDLTSNAPLNYISQLLMEEEIDEKITTYQEEVALRATEKSFYDILGQECYSSSDGPMLDGPQNQKNSTEGYNSKKSNSGSRSGSIENGVGPDFPSYESLLASEDLLSLPIQSLAAQQIQKGAEEAMKFLPNIGELFINRESEGCSRLRGIDQKSHFINKSRRDHETNTQKKPNNSDFDQLEERAHKQANIYSDEPRRNEIFDNVLLLRGHKYIDDGTILREKMQKEMRDGSKRSVGKTSTIAKDWDTNQTVEEPVDLISLLIYCSQSVSTNDHSMAIESIRKIRKHSSPNGDWCQRLAYYFVDGLEARLAGTGSEIYRKLVSKKGSVTDFFKAYRWYLAASPCKRALFYFCNQTILNISKNAQKVHIINFGIIHGFQWPSFFEHFSNWGSSPPKIRITVIEVPEPGFRPRKRVEAIGRLLADYAKSFNVPFEYEGIASKWENVKIEDLKIAKDEVVIVNCPANSEKLSDDETIATASPRDTFLKTIRKIKPRAFIHAVTNGSYNSPFFFSRFRYALTHYSTLFDMLDSTMPRDKIERLLVERDLLVPDAINAIACEGSERVERPENYKQWHARNLRAGFMQLPIDSTIMKNLKDFVRTFYHKEFIIDEDRGWLVMGWKGKILFAFSAWRPDNV